MMNCYSLQVWLQIYMALTNEQLNVIYKITLTNYVLMDIF